jgi:pimeloyl-ACP methyl ester carboxylesterase
MRAYVRILTALSALVLVTGGGGESRAAPAPAEPTSGSLEVPGARLYYEVRGDGPLLVMVPGRKGTADSYQSVAVELSTRYRVVTYDRRGFSRSRLVGAQDYRRRMATDAADVRRLIEHLGDEPATVFGGSSGALVTLEVLIRHPGVVRTVVAHEPPTMRLLPDGDEWIAFFHDVYDTYRRSGVDPALDQFSEGTGISRGPACADTGAPPELCAYEAGNDMYWFERELRQYPAVDLDVEALARRADRLILAGGRGSKQSLCCYQPNVVLAERLDTTVVDLPGGHVGMVTHPAEFAHELIDVLDP